MVACMGFGEQERSRDTAPARVVVPLFEEVHHGRLLRVESVALRVGGGAGGRRGGGGGCECGGWEWGRAGGWVGGASSD